MNDFHLYLGTDQCQLIQEDNVACYIYKFPWEFRLTDKEWELAILEAEVPSANHAEYFYTLCNLVEKTIILGKYLPFLRKFQFYKKKKVLHDLPNPYYFKIRSHIKKIEELKLFIAMPHLPIMPVVNKPLKFLLHFREKQ